MNGWYVVNTRAHQEGRAEVNLARQGFRAWLPTILRSRRHARRIDTLRTPLFPGYLFVEMDPEQTAWSSIVGTFGVRRLLCENGRPAKLPMGFVETLRRALEEKGIASLEQSWLKPGRRVRLLSGPFADYVGTLLNRPAEDRVILLMNVLGREVETLVSTRQIAPA
ncbi:MAG: transcription termination/antitermination protein NusG [Kiloniellales bacterium]